ncbi:hypothetical protein [Microbacterium sp.]|uniref:hypothetical protein n=1 Tax=Microbacterium sp. TaxID=51671 RepID=UPI0039E62904
MSIEGDALTATSGVRTYKVLVAGFTVASVTLLGLSGTSAAASDNNDVVVAPLTASPSDATDEDGERVQIVSESGGQEDGEGVTLVRTAKGKLAVVTTQWGMPRLQGEVIDSYPLVPEGSEPEATITNDALTRTQGFNFDDLPLADTSAMEVVFVSAVTSSSVSLAWSSPAEGAEFTILRDGAPISTTVEHDFVDRTVVPSTSYTYEISAKTNGSKERSSWQYSRTIPLYTLPSSTGKISSGSGPIAPLTYQAYTTAFIYKTFITQKYVSAGIMEAAGCGLSGGVGYGDQFSGDNRGFQLPGPGAPGVTPSYRSMAFLNVNWDNPYPWDVVWTYGVGATKLYDKFGNLKDTRYASTNGIVFQNPSHAGNYAHFGLSHEVGNPFCPPGGAIRYSLPSVEFYRSGTVSVSGSRMPVPAHEAYARFSNSSGSEVWRTLYRGNQGSFTCLIPFFCASENINASYSY